MTGKMYYCSYCGAGHAEEDFRKQKPYYSPKEEITEDIVCSCGCGYILFKNNSPTALSLNVEWKGK